MSIAARIVGLACLIGAPIGMIFTAGTGWFFAVWFGASVIGGFASMAAEYYAHPITSGQPIEK